MLVDYLSDPSATADGQGLIRDFVFLMIEEGEVLLSVRVHILGLLQKDRAHEVVEDLSQFAVIFQVADVLFLDSMLDLVEVCLEF